MLRGSFGQDSRTTEHL